MAQTAQQLNDLIRSKFNALDEVGEIEISPSNLALKVLREIDPKNLSPALVQVAAILELRQLARAVCRQRQFSNEREAEEQGLFSLQLQPRYPAERTIDGEVEDVYVLRAHLTIQERYRNIERLIQEAKAKQDHAEALRAETEDLIRRGELVGTMFSS